MAVEMRDYSVIKEVIREKIDIIDLLEHYGADIANRNVRYDRVRCTCPLHPYADNPSGFSFDLNSKMFTCYTKHCGEDPKDWWFKPKNRSTIPRDIFLFIKMAEERKAYEEGNNNFTCSFNRALEIGAEIANVKLEKGLAYDKEISDQLETKRWTREMARLTAEVEMEICSEEEVQIFQAQLPLAQDYIETRGYDEDVLEFFEIGYSMDGIDEPYNVGKDDFCGRIIIPVRDENGVLVGWSGRLATEDKSIIKRMHKWHHKLDFEKGFVLYNYHNALPYIRDAKEVILVEGPFDVIRLWSYGICNAVAIMGSALTPEQLSLAIRHSMKVKVALDSDGAGKIGQKRVCEQLKPYVDVYTVTLPKGKDPDELDLEEAWIAVSNTERYISIP